MRIVNNNKIRVIITGTTGMVGEGVLHECLQRSDVEAVLIINRRPSRIKHPKLTELIQADFYDLSAVEEQLTGFNACYFCLGVSSAGMAADAYYKTTYTLTMYIAKTLSRLNTEMTFCYLSGGGTDSTEKGNSRWARVKGKTENDLMKLPFYQVFAFRPGFIKPIEGLSHIHNYYKYIGWLFPIGRVLYPNGFITMQELAAALVAVSLEGYPAQVINGKDMIALAKMN